MANLVILESPAKIATVRNYLGSGYKVIASKGHVRDLPKSTLGVDIERDFEAKYINIRGKGDLIRDMKKEAKSASKVFLATDPDREGEAISWHLANALELDEKKAKRVTFNELTKTAIRAAIKNPRPIDMDLVNAQQARRILDRIVGYKISPFLWKSIKSGLSAGRVQSVATRIIVEREEEIKAFVPDEYWTVEASLTAASGGRFRAKFYGDEKGKIDLKTEADAKLVTDEADKFPFVVKSIKKAVRYKAPSAPFTTSTLQQDASRKLGFQSQRIMRVAQELYEGVNLGSENGGVQGLITYMRTDSLRIANEAAEAAKSYIIEKYGEKYYPKSRRIYKSKASAQDAHEAIRPTNIMLEPDMIRRYLSSDQYKLYKLIWSRFTASQMESAALDTVAADIGCGKYIYHSNGSVIRFPGYLSVYEDSDQSGDDAHMLPELTEGEKPTVNGIKSEQHFTEPPARYTEASLIKFLEEMGIGRPSTYTPIITTIISRNYVSREGRSLKPTPLGEVTTKLMKENFPDIVNYKFTAQMEDNLDSIESGKATVSEVLTAFWEDFDRELREAENNIGSKSFEVPPEETDIICEKCGSRMIIKNGRYGKFAACPKYPVCKNTKAITPDGKPLEKKEKKEPEKTGTVCEICGADMVLRTGKFGSFYACSNYPDCKNTKRITKEIGVKCPKCGANIVTKRGRNNFYFYSCEKYPECDFSSWDLPLNEKCPQCGKILFRKKGKNLVVCADKECGYKREEAPEEEEK
ncbi:MAG: type I DNA topoisomerase [Clostridia bacterium]|nr:type I DNA topoisomerase [Clostridia bacterium]